MSDIIFINALSAAFQVKQKPASDEVRRMLREHRDRIAKMAVQCGEIEKAQGAISHLDKLLE